MLTLPAKSTTKTLVAHSTEELAGMPCVQSYEPKSERYRAIGHAELATMVRDGFVGAGYTVDAEKYAVVAKAAGLIGAIELTPPTSLDLSDDVLEKAALLRARSRFITDPSKVPDGIKLVAGFRHSLDGEWAFRVNVAARVLVCSNGMTADVATVDERELHVEGADFEGLVARAVERFGSSIGAVAHLRGAMEALDVSTTEGDAYIVEAGRKGIIPWANTRVAADEWHAPSHPEFRDRNGWSLYNAFTEALKSRAPIGQVQTLDRLADFIVPDAVSVLAALN